MSYPNQGSQRHLVPKGPHRLIFGFVLGALLLSGGTLPSMNRTLIDMPAWQHVGASAWAAFSQWADLGRFGLLLYPLEGIGGTVLTLAAALVFSLHRKTLGGALAVPIGTAVLFSLGVMLTTTQAAPAMLSTPHLSDPASLQQALNTFQFWGGVRSVCGMLTSCANLWTLVAVSRLKEGVMR